MRILIDLRTRRDSWSGPGFFVPCCASLPAIAFAAFLCVFVFSSCRKDERSPEIEPVSDQGAEGEVSRPGEEQPREGPTDEEPHTSAELSAGDPAQADVAAGKSVDIMDVSLIPVKKDLNEAYLRGRKAVYSISMSHPEAGLITTAYQEVESKGGGRYVLKVRRPDYKALQSTRLPVKGVSELAAYVRPSPALQSNAPLIMKLARKAARGSTDGLETALRLERFVYEYIEDKDYSIASATALDTARERKGDCTEHAYLFAAMARALGLPARVVSGLLFAPSFLDKQNVFVYHMWNEVHLGGKWVPFDSTRPDPGVGVTHIALATDDMNAMIPIGGAAVIMKTMGAMSIEAMETFLSHP